MRNLVRAVGALLVMLGVLSTSLWHSLRTERLANAELGTELAAAKAAPAVPAAPTQSIAVSPPAAMPDCPPVAAEPAPAAAQVASFLVTAESRINSAIESDLMLDPEYLEALLTTTRMRLVQSNPGLAETLGLSDAEASHLFDVMAEVQMKFLVPLRTGGSAAYAHGSNTALTAEELRESLAGGNVVRVTLGEARNAQYDDYQRNARPVHVQVASLGSALTSVGLPMSDAQSRALTTALLADQQHQREEAQASRANPVPGALGGTVQTLEENNSRLDETNRRILAVAASSLSTAQLQALREQFDQQATTRRRALDSALGVPGR